MALGSLVCEEALMTIITWWPTTKKLAPSQARVGGHARQTVPAAPGRIPPANHTATFHISGLTLAKQNNNVALASKASFYLPYI